MKKEKLTVQQKIARMKFKQPSKILWWFLYHCIVKPFCYKQFNVEYKIIDDINECKSAAFLIYNHQSRGEFAWFTRMTYPRRLNYVTGYNEFARFKFNFVFNLMHQIPKKNFTTDINSMRGIDSVIKDGGVVCFAPEGMSSITGHNQPIVRGTGALFKHYNIPVYIIKSNGGYLSTHKCCLDERHGKVETSIRLLLTPEQVKEMDANAIDDLIDKELWTDDYDWQKKVHVKWDTNGRICDHMHDIDYKCPKCGAEFQMVGEGNTLKCKACGNGATMDDYYDFHPFNKDCVIKETPSKWTDWEREEVIKEIRKDPNYSFSVKCKVGILPKDHLIKDNKATSEVAGDGLLTIDHNGIHFVGNKEGNEFKFDLSYKIVYTTLMSTDVTFFGFYVNGEYHDFYPEIPCAYKVVLLVEEMHRLHVNTWKNFPWFDYMYKDTK